MTLSVLPLCADPRLVMRLERPYPSTPALSFIDSLLSRTHCSLFTPIYFDRTSCWLTNEAGPFPYICIAIAISSRCRIDAREDMISFTVPADHRDPRIVCLHLSTLFPQPDLTYFLSFNTSQTIWNATATNKLIHRLCCSGQSSKLHVIDFELTKHTDTFTSIAS